MNIGIIFIYIFKKKKKTLLKMEEENKTIPLDESDINLLKRYGMGPYSEKIKKTEEENK